MRTPQEQYDARQAADAKQAAEAHAPDQPMLDPALPSSPEPGTVSDPEALAASEIVKPLTKSEKKTRKQAHRDG